MEITPNPDMELEMLSWIDKRFQLSKPRTGMHMSTLINCLTRSYLDQYSPMPLTKLELLYFSLGFGLQDTIAPTDSTETIHEFSGVTFRPDFEMPKLATEEDILGEIKTTRKRVKSIQVARDLPDSWARYMMGVCKASGKLTYELAILHMIEPDLCCWHVDFSQEEVDMNWDWIMMRKAVWLRCIAESRIPTPYLYCESWECKRCRFAIICEGLSYANSV
uniref:PD-(D/E)XK nuclease superfamily protein n=1 Tax=viral metagenome TaxID=1070528 RepID=A0A6M3K6U5_9ZZZZ